MFGTLLASRALPDLGRFVVIMFACFLAVAPDVAEIPYYFLGLKHIAWIRKLIDFQRSHQWNVKPVWGLIFQVIVAAVSLYFALST